MTVEGALMDRAALAGVLEARFELHLPVLEVGCLDEQAGEDSVDATG